MSRPWWWYALQIPGLLGLIVFATLAYFGIKSLVGHSVLPPIPSADLIVVFGLSGIGWIFGSSLGSWLGALRRKQRKWPTENECLLLALSLAPIIVVISSLFLLPLWAIVILTISIFGYFLLWWLVPAQRSDAKCRNAESSSP